MEQYQKLIKDNPELATDPDTQQYRWMIEEFRVSLFAQELGTAMPVSDKRLNKQWKIITAI